MPVRQVGERSLRFEPLWVRVDRNRVKVGVFVVLFVVGSAALLTVALVWVPGVLLGWGADVIEEVEYATWMAGLPWVVGGAFVLMLAAGALLAAIQLSNAEDWVRSRFKGKKLDPKEAPGLAEAVAQMALAGGLAGPPNMVVLDVESVNACAIGTNRKRPTIAVTRGFLARLDADEQRAVVAVLVARIIAGDILFGTALAALMGPLRAVRESGGAVAGCVGGCLGGSGEKKSSSGSGCGDVGDGCSGCRDVFDGCGGCIEAGNSASTGCFAGVVIALFIALVVAITYLAVVAAAWIVTAWGLLLHRAIHEKADAEGMLLLKDPRPMLSALRKVVASSNEVADGDPSYDGIFYAPTSGVPRIERAEERRLHRLREVLGVEGAASVTP